jgi:PAS domain S-box-containing protein
MLVSRISVPITVRIIALSILLTLCNVPWFQSHASPPAVTAPPVLRVVMDNNYPPYTFVDNEKQPQGILVDQWRLWQEKTGIQVKITAVDWKDALRDMKDGKYDVIDTAFKTDERKTWLDFGGPHTSIEVAAYFEKGISAITTVDSLQGFAVAVKEGDATVSMLLSRGVKDLIFFKGYEDIVQAAKEHKVNVFVIDAPPALYFLHKYNLQDNFKASPPFHIGQFHRAVKKGNGAMLRKIEAGFALISPEELKNIEKKWLGSSLLQKVSRNEILMVGGGIGLFFLLFLIWNYSLRTAVRKRTAELENSQTALQHERQRLEFVIDGSRLGVWEWNVQTNETVFNETWAEMLGYTLRELTPYSYTTWEKLVHSDDVEVAKGALFACVEGKTASYDCEFRMQHKDGHWVWILDRGQVFTRDAEGNPLLMFGTHTDITTIKRAQEEARFTNEMLSQFIKNSPIYAYIKEVSSTGSRTIKASDNLQDLVNMPVAEMVGKTMDELFPPEFAAQITADDWQVFSQGEILRREEVLNGCTYTTIKFPIRLGERNLLAGYTIDITDRVQAEADREKMREQLIQSQKLESVGRLAGGIAHDFNNMLSIILGYTELALQKLEPGDPFHNTMEAIFKAGAHSADIIRQLLAFARKQTVAPKVLNLNKSIESMIQMLRHLIGENINLAWNPRSELWLVKIDPSQIDQILANLCVNARDAITGVGKVTIETQNIRLDKDYCADHMECLPGEYVMLAVSDDGCGIVPEAIDQIFEPFFTTKALGQGTGLGLATVYGIVKQNNGFINVYSEPNQGTTIKVYLPRHIEETVVKKPNEIVSEVPKSQGETILLVEDDAGILKLGEKILENLGYKVLSTSNPRNVKKMIKEYDGQIDLLLTDVVMPEMNGRELSEYVQRVYPQIKILFMSGYTANVIAHQGVLDENICLISKPFSLKEIALKIRELLDQ